MVEAYYAVLFFVFGTIFGSFYNVVGYRLPKKKSLIKPSSHCPKCNLKLSPLELIPILSYIFLLGKCKNCKKKIPIFYPLIELSTGILFLVSYLLFGFTPELIISLVFVSAAVIIIVSDIIYMIIPDEIIVIASVLILFVRLVFSTVIDIPLIFIDALFPFLILYLIKLLGDFIFKKESMGWGDLKLMILFGLAIGWNGAIFSIFVGTFLAFPISLYFFFKKKEHMLAFGPYLCIAALLILFFNINFDYTIKLLYQ
jgi:leader peptidase (prepilin peptidase)/N-methyltransferase